jgi:hypothetical protein
MGMEELTRRVIADEMKQPMAAKMNRKSAKVSQF